MILIIAIVAIIWSLYLYGTETYSYWKKKGVRYDQPLPFLGSVARIFFQKQSMTDYFDELYNKFPQEKFVGYYFARKKGIVLRQPELVKHVMITDFNKFHARAFNPHPDVIEPMFRNLFFADGDLWKLLRQRLTPAFTSGKLKAMFPLIAERAERLQRAAAEGAARGAELDARDLMARYTTDFIGACGFGIDTDSLNDDKSNFRQLGKRIFTITAREAVITTLKWTFPETFKYLNVLPPEVEKETVRLVKEIMQQRDYKPTGRNDFIDLLFELKAKGLIVGESLERRNADGTPQTAELELDELLMAAQVFVFFAAGFETSSSATSYTLHQLAFHPEAQRRCQREVDEVLARHGGKLCYDAVNEMKYLAMCFKEGMRMFPSLGYLTRKSMDRYQFPYTNVTIDKGVRVVIPVQALQNDPRYFEDPDKFIPERFHPDNAVNIKNYTYLPFGDGPRACIGERLGLMQSLAGLAALLSQFSVAPSKSTVRKPPTDPSCSIVQSIKGGIPLSLRLRSKEE